MCNYTRAMPEPGQHASPRRRRDAVEHRRRIVAAAREVLGDDPGASLEAIAERAGLARRTVYGHVDSRDALVAEVVAAGAADLAATIAGVTTAGASDPVDDVARIGAALWDQVDAVRALAALALSSSLRPVVARALDPVRSLLCAAVQRGIADGRFRPDLDASLLAGLVERAAIAVLDEAVLRDLPAATARRLVVTNGLASAGLAWADADAVAIRVLDARRMAA